jgi:hypothetical protein
MTLNGFRPVFFIVRRNQQELQLRSYRCRKQQCGGFCVSVWCFLVINVCNHGEHYETPCIMGLSNNTICRKCGTEEKTSAHVLCECETLASLGHTYLVSFFLDPEDIRKLSIGAIWNCAKGTGLLLLSSEHEGTKGLS